MGLRNAIPMTFRPAGISDALDGSPVFQGAMASLQNLIPDPSTKNLWQCRPAASEEYVFGTLTNPAFVSCLLVVGDRAYGMIASDLTPGHDEPFVYDLAAAAAVVVTGVTPANVPISPATTGAWTPPTMAVVGTRLIVTHPGFTGIGGVWFGWFDISDPTAPVWNGGSVTGAIVFTTAPVGVAAFNDRAWFLVNPAIGQPSAVYTDSLTLVVTNANQALTFDDNVPLTAIGQLPLNNQLGGIIQGLIVFKGTAKLYQITGDAASSTLSRNALNVSTGTLAPRSLANTPFGLAFIAPDGLRVIDFTAKVTDPVGFDGAGKTLPFLFAVIPSRIAAACNGNVLRITVQDGSLVGSPTREYWYDLVRKIWSGPHTFPASAISQWNNTFMMAPVDVTGSLWQSDVVQGATSSFTENGTDLTFQWLSCMLPDTDQMAEYAMVQTTIYMAFAQSGAGSSYTVQAMDQDGVVLQTATIEVTGSATVWGGFIWGQAPWGAAQTALFPRVVPWPAPVEFRRMQINLQGTSAVGLRISTMHLRYQKLGYLQAPAA